jgi:uncharacterized protein (DUF2141 family)
VAHDRFDLPGFAVRVIALLLAAVTISPAPVSTFPTLTIAAEGVRNSRGVIGVLIFTSARGWPEDFGAAFRSEAMPAHPGTVVLAFKDLPPGAYAAVVLHDENENRKLDRNFLGIPREGWGMSNNPKARGAAPSFDRARFSLERDTTLTIDLNY